ncbi:MAG: ATP-dependent DNA ligase, partial [Myxococcota bacterium]
MLFDRLVTTSADLRGVRARNKKRTLLATLLADTPPSLVPVVVAYLSGDLPQGKIGLGWAAVRDAQTRGAPTPTLTVEEVDRSLEEIGRCEGAGSQKEKHERFTELLARATEAEQSFLGQLVIGELRQGALEGVMLDAIAQAFEVPLAAVRRAAMMAGSAPEIGRAAATEGEAGLDRFQLTLFRPVQPMLAQPAEEVDDALDRHGESAFEVKVDGARIQIHKRGNDVRIYTRGLHDVTERVPDIVEVVRAFPAQELIADGEAVALRGDGRPEPFQVTMGRFGGRLEVNAMRESVPLTTYLFDCLWLDGEALIDLSLSDRFTALQRGTSEAVLLPRIITSDRDKAQQFFEDSLAAGHEGAMAKALSAPY